MSIQPQQPKNNLPFIGGPNEPLTMSSREIAELVEKRHDNVKRTVEMLVSHGTIVRPQIEDEQDTDAMGRSRTTSVYRLDERSSYIVVAQLSPEFTARLVDEWKALKERVSNTLPDFTDPIAAARAWADEKEARQIAERTKAEIGSRREATAMATASAAVRKANSLELVLDRSQSYATVKRMQSVYKGDFKWRELKAVSAELNLPPIDVFDANYGTVKAYHTAVWQHVYGVEAPQAIVARA